MDNHISNDTLDNRLSEEMGTEWRLESLRPKKGEKMDIVAFLIWLALVIAVVVAVLGCRPAHAYTDEQIVNAIWCAEGKEKATYAYGIRSVSYDSIEEARRICANSVRNTRKRWAKAGEPEDMIIFMSRRYCPVNAPNDPHGLNKNWVKNVKFFLAKAEGEDK